MAHRVIESVKAGKRLHEARFTDLKIAASAQKSVHHMVTKVKDAPDQSQAKRLAGKGTRTGSKSWVTDYI